MKGLAKEHIPLTHRRRQLCGNGQREGGAGRVGSWVEVGKGENMETSVIMSTKIKFKKSEF